MALGSLNPLTLDRLFKVGGVIQGSTRLFQTSNSGHKREARASFEVKYLSSRHPSTCVVLPFYLSTLP